MNQLELLAELLPCRVLGEAGSFSLVVARSVVVALVHHLAADD